MQARQLKRPGTIDPGLLKAWPLPEPPKDADKEIRGRVLIVAGARQLAGVPILCGEAALRAGAGKVTIAAPESIAAVVGLALPECRVIGLPEGQSEKNNKAAVAKIPAHCLEQDAVLIGPGMEGERGAVNFASALLPRLKCDRIILDASAMGAVKGSQAGSRRKVLITPHAGELAHLLDCNRSRIEEDGALAAVGAAHRWDCLVALKGATTHIATPMGQLWRFDGGHEGLGVSGSGDVLAGIILGLAGRGAALEQAAAWGVALHGFAGRRLAEKMGTIGYLAREIPRQVPPLMHRLCKRRGRRLK